MSTCPLHKTELVFEEKAKHKLICPVKNCPHTEYTSSLNPNSSKFITLPFWCNK